MRSAQPITTARTRNLRRHSTDAETKLWLALRDRRLEGYKFVRQAAIGRYIVDFVCRDQRLVVEVDGGQHNESRTDKLRDAALAQEGYRIVRFWNNDVLGNLNGVLQTLLQELKTRQS